MNAQILIDSIVRQITVLVAQLATSGGVRAPVAHLANQVFVELANELHAQGISRKVGADMFGMALRAYIRKLRRLSEGKTERGRTLWQAMLDFIRAEGLASRKRVLQRFSHDGEEQVTAILHDLTESGLVFHSGSGAAGVYRVASDEELGKVSEVAGEQGLEEMVLAVLYRSGPCTLQELAAELGHPVPELPGIVQALTTSGRAEECEQGRYRALDLVIPLGATVGWEAAVFDHVQAMVQTICQRLQLNAASTDANDVVGGSTYTYEVWPGHPLEHAVKGQLATLREQCHQLRQKVEAHNKAHGLSSRHDQVTTYVGQNIIERDVGVARAEAEEGAT